LEVNLRPFQPFQLLFRRADSTCVFVRKLHTLIASLLVLAWVPVTFHCTLENLPGLEFLNCCSHDEQGCQGEKDCEADACAVVETGAYKIDDNQLVAPLPPLLAVAFLEGLPQDNSFSLRETLPVPSEDRLSEFLPRWQFLFRAASPPRAPSICS
jgi:hypothetical protein